MRRTLPGFDPTPGGTVAQSGGRTPVHRNIQEEPCPNAPPKKY